MSEYIKQTWVDGETPVDAEHMNHIEEGVAAAHKAIAELPEIPEIPKIPVVDNTLSVPGAAADAKATGDRITALSEEIDALKGGGTVEVTETSTGDIVTVTPASGTRMQVVSNISGLNTSWERANKLRLRHLSGKNLFDFASLFGGAGNVIEKNGQTATINDDATVTITGTNTSSSNNNILSAYVNAWENGDYVFAFPAGTYTLPSRLVITAGKLDGSITSLGQQRNTFTVNEPFTIRQVYITYEAGATANDTIPLYMVSGASTITSGYAFAGKVYDADFTTAVSDGVFNWHTGVLKDSDGNTVENLDAFERFPAYVGENIFMTGVGESTVSYTVVTEGDGDSSNAVVDVFDPTVWGLPVLTLDGDCTGMTKDDYVNLAYTFMGMSGNVDVKKQGSSSIQTGIAIGGAFDDYLGGIFNFTLKFPEAFEAKEGWGAQKKYCFKANAIDHSHCRNVVSCKLWGQIVKSRVNVPTELSSLPNGGAIDGFPIIIVLNGKFYALGTFNIPKDGWMFGSPKAILCADKHVDATNFRGLANLTSDFELEYVEDEDNADWVLTSLNTAIQAVIDSNGKDLDTTVSQYIDIPSAMDYFIHAVHESATDCTDKNYILVTFDGVKWYFSDYDRDSTYGLYWDGTQIVTPIDGVRYTTYGSSHRVMKLIKENKATELKARAVELRNGVLSEANVATVFYNFAGSIPAEVYAQNAKRWPLLRCTSVSNVEQILNWYRMRMAYIAPLTDALA